MRSRAGTASPRLSITRRLPLFMLRGSNIKCQQFSYNEIAFHKAEAFRYD